MPPPPSAKFCPYATLQLSPGASLAQIKAAYRRLARETHPDQNPSAGEAFKAVNQAYHLLKTAELKAAYDAAQVPKAPPPSAAAPKQAATAKTQPPPPPSPKASTPPPVAAPPPQAPPKPNGSSWWQTLTGQGNAQGQTPPPSTAKPKPKAEPAAALPLVQVSLPLALTPQQAQQGVTLPLSLSYTLPCTHCMGTGRIRGQWCAHCNGQGHATVHDELLVSVPAGVQNNQRLKLMGDKLKGLKHALHAESEVVLQTSVPLLGGLQTKGLHVWLEQPVSPAQLALGATLTVPTLTGSVELTIPAGSQHGQVLRLKGQGVSQGGLQGDQLVTLLVSIPKHLSAKQKQAYQQLLQADS